VPQWALDDVDRHPSRASSTACGSGRSPPETPQPGTRADR
jgi:hypothetical protein